MGVETSYVWCQKETGGPNRPHDAHDASSWLGTCLLLKISVLVGSGLYDKHETGLACIAQAKLYKMSMLHGCWVCVVHISSTFVAPELVQFVKCGC